MPEPVANVVQKVATTSPAQPDYGYHVGGDINDVNTMRDLIQRGAQASSHRDANDVDYDYWTKKMQQNGGATDYWWQRLLGNEAGGKDTAKFGPYAGMDFDKGKQQRPATMQQPLFGQQPTPQLFGQSNMQTKVTAPQPENVVAPVQTTNPVPAGKQLNVNNMSQEAMNGILSNRAF